MEQFFQLEGHKLAYHPDRVADFLAGCLVWPIYAEISPTSDCNHHCRFCNFNYLGHQGAYFPSGRLLTLVDELKQAGVKAVVFAGAGEPSLHPDTFPAIRRSREIGLDVAMSSNGAALQDGQLREMAQYLTWVRFSVNGGTPAAYAACQGTGAGDLDVVLDNITRLFKYKESFASSLTIGAQCVLLPENQNTLVELARRLKQAGADYFSVKHFYNHPGNRYQPDMAFRTPEFLAGLQSELGMLAGKTFQVTLRNIGLVENSRQYSVCHGLPFIVYVREDGQLYTCFSHQEDPQAVLGNLGETDFASLWRSTEKKAAIEYINQHYDKKSCQANCRHHEINQWLEQLSTPPPHVNFV